MAARPIAIVVPTPTALWRDVRDSAFPRPGIAATGVIPGLPAEVAPACSLFYMCLFLGPPTAKASPPGDRPWRNRLHRTGSDIYRDRLDHAVDLIDAIPVEVMVTFIFSCQHKSRGRHPITVMFTGLLVPG